MSERDSYITIYQSFGGWKAIEIWFNPESGGYWEPWNTGLGVYDTPEQAETEARAWARDEGLKYRVLGGVLGG